MSWIQAKSCTHTPGASQEVQFAMQPCLQSIKITFSVRLPPRSDPFGQSVGATLFTRIADRPYGMPVSAGNDREFQGVEEGLNGRLKGNGHRNLNGLSSKLKRLASGSKEIVEP